MAPDQMGGRRDEVAVGVALAFSSCQAEVCEVGGGEGGFRPGPPASICYDRKLALTVETSGFDVAGDATFSRLASGITTRLRPLS